MTTYQNQLFTGERSLFAEQDATLNQVTFSDGESPLKESRNINLKNTIFKWKYPLWYSNHIEADHIILEEMSRSGIWYTNDIKVTNSSIQAPKEFRRGKGITLINDYFSDADETLWNCSDIHIENVQARGDYFGMNSENIYADHLSLIGNYGFDGAKNVEIHNSTFVTKDAFWNCENVTIYDSTINGEYLGWNTKNLTLINCTIESDQGLCYIDHLVMKNCTLLETDLAFEYCSDIDADIHSNITSVKNPINGIIKAESIGELIMEVDKVDPSKTTIITNDAQTERRAG